MAGVKGGRRQWNPSEVGLGVGWIMGHPMRTGVMEEGKRGRTR